MMQFAETWIKKWLRQEQALQVWNADGIRKVPKLVCPSFVWLDLFAWLFHLWRPPLVSKFLHKLKRRKSDKLSHHVSNFARSRQFVQAVLQEKARCVECLRSFQAPHPEPSDAKHAHLTLNHSNLNAVRRCELVLPLQCAIAFTLICTCCSLLSCSPTCFGASGPKQEILFQGW